MGMGFAPTCFLRWPPPLLHKTTLTTGWERSLTISSAVWIEYTNVTDRQTDRQTEGQTPPTAKTRRRKKSALTSYHFVYSSFGNSSHEKKFLSRRVGMGEGYMSRDARRRWPSFPVTRGTACHFRCFASCLPPSPEGSVCSELLRRTFNVHSANWRSHFEHIIGSFYWLFYVPNSAALVLRVLFVASGYLFFYLQSFTGNRQPPFYVPMCR